MSGVESHFIRSCLTGSFTTIKPGRGDRVLNARRAAISNGCAITAKHRDVMVRRSGERPTLAPPVRSRRTGKPRARFHPPTKFKAKNKASSAEQEALFPDFAIPRLDPMRRTGRIQLPAEPLLGFVIPGLDRGIQARSLSSSNWTPRSSRGVTGLILASRGLTRRIWPSRGVTAEDLNCCRERTTNA